MLENVIQKSELKLIQSKKKLIQHKSTLSVKNREKKYLKTKQNEELLCVFKYNSTKWRINFCVHEVHFFRIFYLVKPF